MSSEVSDLASDPSPVSHMSFISAGPVSYAGGVEKEPVHWLNAWMNVITGEEIIRKDL